MNKKVQQKYIEIISAQQNNLKSVNLKIPLGSMTVVCGPSGSGKSSLAFETLFAEGQRHYTATLSNYTRQYIQELPKPLVEHIYNIPPALALEQKNSVRSSRPVVATLTDLADCLRLLFTHVGQVYCPRHKVPLCSYSPQSGAKQILKTFSGKRGLILVPIRVPVSRKEQNELKKQLLKQGFQKICCEKNNSGKKLPDIKYLNQIKQFPKGKCHLLLDRLVFKDSVRLTDSLRLAYKMSVQQGQKKGGEVKIFSTEGNSLYIREQEGCSYCDYIFPLPFQPALFNFNSSLGACPDCRGFGTHLVLDEKKIVPQAWKSLAEGALVPFTLPSTTAELRHLKQFCHQKRIDWHCPWEKLPARHKKSIWKGSSKFIGVEGFFNYLENKKYKMYVRVFLARYKSPKACTVCRGYRFRKELDFIYFKNKSLPEFFSMDMGTLQTFFKKLKLSASEEKKTKDLIQKIHIILESAIQIGLGYLELNREIRTLSSGEFQRLNLINQLGLGLSQVLYVLDEPTVGLHPQDTQRLVQLLQNLNQMDNTLVVVEHDPDMIRQASFIVEMGPGSGFAGGNIVFIGSKEEFFKKNTTPTSRYLNQKQNRKLLFPLQAVDKKHHKYFLEITGCTTHNLKNVSLKVPLNRMVAVSGVSGSGKSSLVSKTLYPALASVLQKRVFPCGGFKNLIGWRYLEEVVMIDSSPVEKTRRSLPVTYLKFYDHIRNLMAGYAQSDIDEFIRPGYFSLNVEGGRCPVCRGLGYQEIDMVFMDPIRLTCEECGGKRFKSEILSWKWRNKNIYDILNMTVQEALDFFVSTPAIWKPLSLLKKTGLAYLILGQSLSTLSGGESQRLKLTRELLKSQSRNTLYIMDEPTVGLHFSEVELLLKVLHQLIQNGNSVLLIEHNLELLRHCDYLIEMGPSAGKKGGKIQIQGSPAELALNPLSSTGIFLKKF